MGFFPSDYKSTAETQAPKDPRYIDISKVPKDGTVTVRPCGNGNSGHVIAGWQYYSESQKRTLRFPVFPDNYLEDIGLSFKGKRDKTGEKDSPKYFVSFAALSKETGDFAIVTIAKDPPREDLEKILGMEDYQVADGEMANFTLTLGKTGSGTDTKYSVMPVLKAAPKELHTRWKGARDKIWLPALFSGGDPFAGKPAGGEPVGLPPTARDELGADSEITPAPTAGW
jgi:hypothetical protein